MGSQPSLGVLDLASALEDGPERVWWVKTEWGAVSLA